MARVYPSAGEIYSGTYTPIASSGFNVVTDNIVIQRANYLRVGNIVTVYGELSVSPSATGDTYFKLTTPFKTTNSNDNGCGSVFAPQSYSAKTYGACYVADSSNMWVRFDATVTTQYSYYYNYTYTIGD